MTDQLPPDHQSHEKLERHTFLLMLLLVSALFLFLLEPFFSPIFWACVIAILFFPLQARLTRRWQRPNLASLATLGVCVLVAIAPALFLLSSLIQEGSQLYIRLESGEFNPSAYVDQIRKGFPGVENFLDRMEFDLESLKAQASGAAVGVSGWLAQNALAIGQNMLQVVVKLALMLYLAFFLLRDGPALINLLIRALPLGDAREKLLFTKFAEVTRATVKGNLVVAVVQGSLGGVIFWLLGIPGAVLWGAVMVVLSLIPVVGAAVIWGPVAIYLFAVGDWGKGLILVAFGAGVIGLVDNVLRPILVGRDTKLPDYVVLLSTLGGFALFGMNGFVIGPLIAALFMVFWQIFIIDFYNGHSYPGESEKASEEDPPEHASPERRVDTELPQADH